ncbi:hypothetical protein D3C75_1035090 [compost metagenome]
MEALSSSEDAEISSDDPEISSEIDDNVFILFRIISLSLSILSAEFLTISILGITSSTACIIRLKETIVLSIIPA